MAQSYTWSDVLNHAKWRVKNAPVDRDPSAGLITCQLASNEIWNFRDWRWNITNISAGSIPLVDGQQDYNAPTRIKRLRTLSIERTDVTPHEVRELNVVGDLAKDLRPSSYAAIRSGCMKFAYGRIWLEKAVQVPSGVTLELRGEYKMVAPTITSLASTLWFDDDYFNVAVAALLATAYEATDDARAGNTQSAFDGRPVMTGYRGELNALLEKMAAEEDTDSIDALFPGEGLTQNVGITNSFSVFGA